MHVEGWSNQEIADHHNASTPIQVTPITAPAVAQAVSRTRKKIRKFYNSDLPPTA